MPASLSVHEFYTPQILRPESSFLLYLSVLGFLSLDFESSTPVAHQAHSWLILVSWGPIGGEYLPCHRQTTHDIGLKYLIWFACTMHSPGHQLACASILNFKEVIYLFDIRSNLFQSGICLQKWLFCTVFLDKVWSSENTFFSQMKEFKRQTHHLLKK